MFLTRIIFLNNLIKSFILNKNFIFSVFSLTVKIWGVKHAERIALGFIAASHSALRKH